MAITKSLTKNKKSVSLITVKIFIKQLNTNNKENHKQTKTEDTQKCHK